MNESPNPNFKRWHESYQRALTMEGDGVVRVFEQMVGKPPLPSDKEAHKIYFHLLEDLCRMRDFEKQYPLAMVAFGSARWEFRLIFDCCSICETIYLAYSFCLLSAGSVK